jgi:hypothetical protein
VCQLTGENAKDHDGWSIIVTIQYSANDYTAMLLVQRNAVITIAMMV